MYIFVPLVPPSLSSLAMAAFSQQLQLQLKLQQQQQQQSMPFRNLVPIDGQIPSPVAFFNNTNYSDQPHPSFVHVMGLAPGSVSAAGAGGGLNEWEPQRKRLKEQDFLDSSNTNSVDFLQAGSVSTGLGLSLDDGRVAASSGDSPLPLLPMVDSDVTRELHRMDAEMDRFIRIQGERLRQSIVENFQAKQLQTLASLEEKILRKIREKEAELEDINKKNMELEELSTQLNIEVATWQQRAKYNENMIAALKFNLQQVYAQGRDNKEGCGDSEVDDTASCYNGGGIDFQLLCKENQDIKESMACKVCRLNDACMLLLPCRHLCLCKDCESQLSSCPLCRSSKLLGMEIFM